MLFVWMLGLGVGEAAPHCVQTQHLRAARPNLSGPVQILDSEGGRFRIHYTLEGVDKAEGGVDEAGVPHMARRVAQAMEEGSRAFAKRGYRTENLDDGQEGSEAIDVYLKEIDANGYANVTEGASGTDSCFVRIDNGLGSVGGQILESVAIHELHHCVQYAYTTQTDPFMYEATATFEQYLAIEDEALDIALNVLYVERLEHPEYALAAVQGRYHYAGLLFMKFLAEYGTPDLGRIPALWVALEQEPNWEDAVWSEARRIWDQSFDEVFLEFAVFNGFACARDAGEHYDPSYLPCTANVEVPYTSVAGGTRSVEVALSEPRYSAGYARWIAPTPELIPELICSAPDSGTAELRVAWDQLDASGRVLAHTSTVIMENGTRLFSGTPTPQGGTLLATFASTGDAPVSATCVLEEVAPASDGCACSSTPTASMMSLKGMLCMLPLLCAVGRFRRVR